jgi:hypothetical protein
MLLLKKNKFVFIAFVLIFTTGCFPKFIAKSISIFDNKINLQVLTNNEIVVCFIPMHHIGTKQFYDDVQLNIDTFKKQGFSIFYEGVTLDTSLPKAELDTIYKKFRKITGMAISKSEYKGYIDTANSSIMGLKAKWIKKEKIVNQPKSLVGTSNSKDLNAVDLSIPELVAQYEKKHGTIVLEANDYKTDTHKALSNGATYENRKLMILDLRDKHLAKKIITATNNKIVVVYGNAHLPGLLKNLKLVDSSFKNLSAITKQ